jgi:CheY-like chemotaxis protein
MTQPVILLVDDEPDLLALGAQALREAGYKVMTAVNGDIAEIMIGQVAFDALITDIVMPGMLDGFSLARKAKVATPALRIVYTTGFTGVSNVRSRGAPFGEFLPKPWRPSELVRIIASLVPAFA